MAAPKTDPGTARDHMFEEVRAAKAYTSSINNPEHQAKVELAAFMAIFHPEKEHSHV